MSKRDILTGTWSTRIQQRRGLDLITSCVRVKSLGSECATERANSILGNIENIRYTRRGAMKADLYDGRDFLGEMTIRKGYNEWTEGRSFFDGGLRLNTRKDEMIMLDDDFARGMVMKVEYAFDI